MNQHRRNGQKENDKRTRVSRACTNCRKAHACCDTLRPCSRCIKFGLQSSCRDALSHKRGPKRKREDLWLNKLDQIGRFNNANNINDINNHNNNNHNNESNNDTSANTFHNGRVMVATFFPSRNKPNEHVNDTQTTERKTSNASSPSQFSYAQFSVANKLKKKKNLKHRNRSAVSSFKISPSASTFHSNTYTNNINNNSNNNDINPQHINNISNKNDPFTNNKNNNHIRNDSLLESSSSIDEEIDTSLISRNICEEHIDINQSGKVHLKLPISDLCSLSEHDQYHNGIENEEELSPRFSQLDDNNWHHSDHNDEILDLDISIEDSVPSSLSGRYNYFHVKVGHIIFEKQFCLSFVSREIMRVWGYSAQELKRMTFLDLCHPDYVPLSQKKGEELRKMYMSLPADGSTRSFVLGRGVGKGKHNVFEYWHKTYAQTLPNGKMVAYSYFYFY